MRRFLLSTEDYLAVERVLLLLGIGAKLTAGYVVETDDPAVTPLLGKLAKMVEDIPHPQPLPLRGRGEGEGEEGKAGWPLLVGRRSGWVMGAPRMAEEGVEEGEGSFRLRVVQRLWRLGEVGVGTPAPGACHAPLREEDEIQGEGGAA